MAETLYIENFGPIKKAELDLRQAMVLIGPQSSGKSAIAKLISILRDWRFVNREDTFETLLDNFNIKSFYSPKTIIRYRSNSHHFTLERGEDDFKLNPSHNHTQTLLKVIEYHTANPSPTRDKHIELLQNLLDEGKSLLAKSEASEVEVEKENLRKQAYELYKELEKQFEVFNQKEMHGEEVRNALNQFTNYSQYIPAERILTSIYSNSISSFLSSNLPIPKNIIDFTAAYERARQATPKFKIPFLDFRYSYESGNDMVYSNEKEGYPLKQSSTGLQTLIPLLLVIAHKWTDEQKLYSFVVEEPEQNLYPLAQQKLIYLLSERCLQNDEQRNNRSDLVITTHSPYVLTSFNNLLFAALVSEKAKDRESVYDIIPEQAHIKSDNFNAYYVSEGTVREIFDRKTGLIADNELDSASDEIMHDFNALMDIYKRKKGAGSN